MEFVAVFLPACISMSILYRRNGNKSITGSLLYDIFKYVEWVIGINLINLFLICVVLRRTEIYSSAFDKLSVSMAYTSIACFWAILLPYVFETVRKFFSITFDTKF